MPDMSLIREKLEQIEESLHRIDRRSSSIKSPEDFSASEDNLDKLDAIAMMASSGFATFLLMIISISIPRKFSKSADGTSQSL